MDNVYRVFQKGEDSKSGTVVTGLKLKSIITQPLEGEELSPVPLSYWVPPMEGKRISIAWRCPWTTAKAGDRRI